MDDVMTLEEKELVWAAQVRVTLSRRNNFQPLRSLCLHKVTESLLHYANNGMTNIYKVLPSTLCSELFSNFASYINQYPCSKAFVNLNTLDYLKVAYLFVDAQLQNLDDGILHEYSSEKAEAAQQDTFLVHLAAKVKNLKSLAVNDQRICDFHLYYKLFSSSILKLSFKFVTIEKEHLLLISEACGGLQFLEMQFEWRTTNNDFLSLDLAPLTRLPSLQYLLFDVALYEYETNDADYIEHLNIARFFLEEMPHLKINGNFYDVMDEYFAEHDFTVFEHPTELALREVNLKADQIVPRFVSLPHVISLNMCGADLQVYNLASLPEFPKLTRLSFTNFTSHQMKILMEKYGGNLQHLDIEPSVDLCNLVHILKLCPKLHTLEIDSVLVEINTTQLSKNCFSQLKKINIYHETHKMSSNGLLHMLFLHALVLKEIYMSICSIDLNECSNITKDLESGRGSGHHLSDLTLHCNPLFHDDDGKEIFLNSIYQLWTSSKNLSSVYFYDCHDFSQAQAMNALLVPLRKTLETFKKPFEINVMSA